MCVHHVLPNKQLVPTSVGINTFFTIMLLALTTNCDGGVHTRGLGYLFE